MSAPPPAPTRLALRGGPSGNPSSATQTDGDQRAELPKKAPPPSPSQREVDELFADVAPGPAAEPKQLLILPMKAPPAGVSGRPKMKQPPPKSGNQMEAPAPAEPHR